MLGGLRARLADDPILVVPTLGDVEHAQRELAERGAVFGARVLRFTWLFEEIAARAGYGQRDGVGLPARAARGGGGARDEAERARASRRPSPGSPEPRPVSWPSWGASARRWSPRASPSALRNWAGRGPAARVRGRGGGAYTAAIAPGSTGSGLVDEELFAWRALDALRAGRARPGGARRCSSTASTISTGSSSTRSTRSRTGRGADVTVSLPFEPGRRAFKAVATLHEELLALGADELELAPVDDHYAPESRAALHHVERLLFEDDPPSKAEPGERDLVPLRGRGAGRGRAGRRAGPPAPAQRCRARRRRSGVQGARRATRRCSSRSSAPTGSRTRSTASCPSGTPASAAACWH